MKSFNKFLNEKNKGLWDNIHAKRKRGEKPNPPGHPDRPTAQDFKNAQKTSKEEYSSDAQRKAVWASRNDEKKSKKEAVEEKKLTPAELKKREEIAKAMERDNPGMNMSKKMAIATATAKKVAEEVDSSMCCKHCGDQFGKPTNEKCMYDAYDPKGKNWVKKESYNEAKVDEVSLSHLSNTIAKSTGTKNIKTAMKPGEVKKGLDDLKKRLATLGDPKLAKEAYRVHAVSKDGEKMKSGLHPTKKAASDMHYKMAKSGMYKKIEVVKEAIEDDEPASPDEASMALKQLEFIEYAAEEMMDHIKSGKAFPEWFQNKLAKAHGEIEGLHSAMGEHGGDEDEEDMKEAVRKGAPKMQGDFLKKERERNRAHDAAMGRTPTGRKKPVRTMTSTQRSLAKMRNEAVQSADRKPEKYIKPDGKVGIRMARTDKKVVSKDA